ncbi:F-box/RNI-like superfamily protein [Rhynchospora pubera]|uniref:F-box/RNI-like superfamily protein n=1 Tax=Rhynchospora pubera TaxID=906938 RepID=A0AAV8F6B8_9POAL|nr:F-box/RNI-like superfamily protein [Rhynchospora pubera]
MAPHPKRRCLSPTPVSASASLDRLLQSVLATADPSVSVAIGLSLERLLDSIPLHSDKESLVHGARNIASSLLEASTRFAQKLAVAHNASVWPLPAELTTKVFSLLDTESLCFAAATCLHFTKCASDPSCYANIDLTRSPAKVTNPVVSAMIQRAANNLHSIKLGSLLQDDNRFHQSPLTESCLAALELNRGAAGLLLRKLHLYNLKIGCYYQCSALSTCKFLSELEIVGIRFRFSSIWRTICEHCHSIERLCLESVAGFPLQACQVDDLIKSCPLLSSLALRRLGIWDDQLSILVKEAHGIKFLDLSYSSVFSGSFLRDLGNAGSTNCLETLILRDCMDLDAEEVSLFLSAACYGHWKSLRYVDISNKKGLLDFRGSSGPNTRCAIKVSQLVRGRPDIHLKADYPQEICFYDDCMDLFSSSESEPSFSSDDEDSP